MKIKNELSFSQRKIDKSPPQRPSLTFVPSVEGPSMSQLLPLSIGITFVSSMPPLERRGGSVGVIIPESEIYPGLPSIKATMGGSFVRGGGWVVALEGRYS